MYDTVQFYFSFRSPYSWLGFYRLSRIAGQLPVAVEYIPCIPPEDFVRSSLENKRKILYIAGDIKRFTDAYGLKISWPEQFDTEWIVPHSAYIHAWDNNKDTAFALAAYSARFEGGENIGNDHAISNIAIRSGLDPDETVEAAHDKQIQSRVLEGMKSITRNGMFGVPFFIYKRQKYWGNDRLDWLLRDIYRDAGKPVPDLGKDPFSRPF